MSGFDDDEFDDSGVAVSKFSRRKKRPERPLHETKMRTMDEVERDTDRALDDALKSISATEAVASATAEQLASQGSQLEKIDRDLHETEEGLTRSQHVISKMKKPMGFAGLAKKGRSEEYVSPLERPSVRSIRKGWLSKKGLSMTAPKKRFCVLSSERKVYYFADEALSDLKGTIDLSSIPESGIDAAVSRSDKSSDAAKGWWFIQTKSRKWWLKADSADEAASWVSSVRSVTRGDHERILHKTKDGAGVSGVGRGGSAMSGGDSAMDSKLDDLLTGVRKVHAIAADINDELDRQDLYLDSIDARMDRVQQKMKGQVKQMDQIR